mgnify:CR=1 FL=1
MSLKIACAQLNQRVGDMAGNAERIIAAAARAAGEGAQVLLTPDPVALIRAEARGLLREEAQG